MAEYGYLHLGRVLRSTSTGYTVEVITRAPGRTWGPIASTVPDLAVGERVVLAQLGTSADALVIIGRIPGRASGIGEIPGLQAALDAKLDDIQLDAASGVAALDASRKVAYARLPVGSVASTVAAGDDARLSDARAPLAHHTTHSTGGTDPIAPADIGAATASDVAGLLAREEYDAQRNFWLYVDAVTTMSRYAASAAGGALGSGNAYAYMTWVSKPITMRNASIDVASGAGSTVVASVYAGTAAAGSMSLVSTGPGTTLAAGLNAVPCTTGAGGFTVPAGYVVVVVKVTGVTGTLTLQGTAALHASMVTGLGNMLTACSKAMAGSPPASVNTADGSWSALASMAWVALD